MGSSTHVKPWSRPLTGMHPATRFPVRRRQSVVHLNQTLPCVDPWNSSQQLDTPFALCILLDVSLHHLWLCSDEVTMHVTVWNVSCQGTGFSTWLCPLNLCNHYLVTESIHANIFNYIKCINLFFVIKSGAGQQPAGSPGNEETEPSCKYHPATWTDFVSTRGLWNYSVATRYFHVACHINLISHFSDKETGTLSLICELMEMNIYEFIQGKSSAST